MLDWGDAVDAVSPGSDSKLSLVPLIVACAAFRRFAMFSNHAPVRLYPSETGVVGTFVGGFEGWIDGSGVFQKGLSEDSTWNCGSGVGSSEVGKRVWLIAFHPLEKGMFSVPGVFMMPVLLKYPNHKWSKNFRLLQNWRKLERMSCETFRVLKSQLGSYSRSAWFTLCLEREQLFCEFLWIQNSTGHFLLWSVSRACILWKPWYYQAANQQLCTSNQQKKKEKYDRDCKHDSTSRESSFNKGILYWLRCRTESLEVWIEREILRQSWQWRRSNAFTW